MNGKWYFHWNKLYYFNIGRHGLLPTYLYYTDYYLLCRAVIHGHTQGNIQTAHACTQICHNREHHYSMPTIIIILIPHSNYMGWMMEHIRLCKWQLYDYSVGNVRVKNTVYWKYDFHYLEQRTLVNVRHPFLFFRLSFNTMSCILSMYVEFPSSNFDFGYDVNTAWRLQ